MKISVFFMYVVMMISLSAISLQAASKVSINKKTITLMPYSTYVLTVKNTTAKVRWSSQFPQIVSVSSDGKITANKIGTSKIKAKVGKKTYVCKVKVKQPNTSNKKARQAFKKFLQGKIKKWGGSMGKRKESDYKFICLDMGKGKIPTMIVTCDDAAHYEGNIRVYQYINGKIKKIASQDWISEIEPEAGVFAICYMGGGYGEVERYFYKTSGKVSAKKIASTFILQGEEMRALFGEDRYEIGGKRITKKEFQRYYNKVTANSSKNKKIKKLLIKNTAKNRAVYFG
ncbi:MAG: hypothetical protein HFI88_07320 [Lachnospiraceae bacterium]|nr:hypothetical protein [Lachnospiraceae bacterium]